jgi:hypothetical protein
MWINKGYAKENTEVPDKLIRKKEEARGKGNWMIRGLGRLPRRKIPEPGTTHFLGGFILLPIQKKRWPESPLSHLKYVMGLYS